MKRKIILAFTFVLVLSLAATAVFAATITWKGNGTTGGFCNTLILDTTVAQDKQVWHFVLTGAASSGNFLWYEFSDGNKLLPPDPGLAATNVTGGTAHFYVTTTAGATLLSASAVNGGTRSQLNVSHCLVNPPPLTVEKTAETSFVRTFNWTIEKSANPDSLDLFYGQSGSSTYTVEVTKDAGTDSNWEVHGTITIHNPAVFSATITNIADDITGWGPVGVTCPGGLSQSLAAGADLVCTYSSPLPNGDARLNTATVTTSGVVGGGSGNANVIFGEPTTLVNDEIDVTDTNPGVGPWHFANSDSVSYDVTFTCGEDQGLHNNTASIVGGNSDSATVAVNCYGLRVEKTAQTSFDRQWFWDISKTGDSEVTIATNATTMVNYSVGVSVLGSQNSNFAVSGTITIYNDNPSQDANVTVSDSLAGVNCLSLVVPAGSSLLCTYSRSGLTGSETVNTATASLFGHDYQGSADLHWGEAINDIDECVSVSDSLQGVLGLVCLGNAPATFTYQRTVGPYADAECGDKSIDNTATLTTNDTGTNDNASHTVIVHVTCPTPPQWCSPGYWKVDQHLDSWVGYTPDQYFDEVFGTGPHITLLTSLQGNNVGASDFTRTATSALLSAAAGLNYPYSVAQVIAYVQSGDVSALEAANIDNCPLS